MAAAGTAVEAKTVTIYDLASNVIEVRSPRYFDTNDPQSGQVRTAMTYNGRGLVATRTEAPGVQVEKLIGSGTFDVSLADALAQLATTTGITFNSNAALVNWVEKVGLGTAESQRNRAPKISSAP